jgi:hypothetical protein
MFRACACVEEEICKRMRRILPIARNYLEFFLVCFIGVIGFNPHNLPKSFRIENHGPWITAKYESLDEFSETSIIHVA